MASPKTKPRLNYTLMCDDVRREMGGKFSLMGLFESIFATAFPAVHRQFAIVNEWTGGKGEFMVKIRLLTPNRDQVLSESESKLALFSETQRHRDIAIRYDTSFRFPGTYWIETLLDNEQAGIIPLVVQSVTEQTVH